MILQIAQGDGHRLHLRAIGGSARVKLNRVRCKAGRVHLRVERSVNIGIDTRLLAVRIKIHHLWLAESDFQETFFIQTVKHFFQCRVLRFGLGFDFNRRARRRFIIERHRITFHGRGFEITDVRTISFFHRANIRRLGRLGASITGKGHLVRIRRAKLQIFPLPSFALQWNFLTLILAGDEIFLLAVRSVQFFNQANERRHEQIVRHANIFFGFKFPNIISRQKFAVSLGAHAGRSAL